MKSSKTTFAAVVGAISIIATQIYAVVDMDPATVFELSQVIGALGMLGIGWFARDNDVTSEQAGAR